MAEVPKPAPFTGFALVGLKRLGDHRQLACLLGISVQPRRECDHATAAASRGEPAPCCVRSCGAHPSFARGSDRNGVLFGSCSRMVGSRWPHHTGSPPARQRQRCPQSLKLYVSTTSSARRSTPSSNLQAGQRISPSTIRLVRNRTAAQPRLVATNVHVNSAATTICAILTRLGDGIRLALCDTHPIGRWIRLGLAIGSQPWCTPYRSNRSPTPRP